MANGIVIVLPPQRKCECGGPLTFDVQRFEAFCQTCGLVAHFEWPPLRALPTRLDDGQEAA